MYSDHDRLYPKPDEHATSKQYSTIASTIQSLTRLRASHLSIVVVLHLCVEVLYILLINVDIVDCPVSFFELL